MTLQFGTGAGFSSAHTLPFIWGSGLLWAVLCLCMAVPPFYTQPQAQGLAVPTASRAPVTFLLDGSRADGRGVLVGRADGCCVQPLLVCSLAICMTFGRPAFVLIFYGQYFIYFK